MHFPIVGVLLFATTLLPHFSFAQTSEESEDDEIHQYQVIKPNLGFEVAYTPWAFGEDETVFPNQLTTDTMTGLSFQMDYQPDFLQGCGIIGFGPSLTLYPT